MNTLQNVTVAIALLAAGFGSGALLGSKVLQDVERTSLRERLEERRKERDEARKERDEAKKKYDELWEQHKRRPFRESIDPKNTVTHLDHSTWEECLP